MRFSDQIPRTGPGPCYKYLRKLRDRCTDLFLRLASPSRFFSPSRRKSLSLRLFLSIGLPSFHLSRTTERGRKGGYKRGKKKKEKEKETRTGTSSLLRQEWALRREREREMAIRLYLLRVFEQFSRTEDPLASNPYRESRLRGEEREREGERKSRRSGGRRRRGRRRPVTKSWTTGRSLGERERSDSCSSLDRTQHPRNVSSSILN